MAEGVGALGGLTLGEVAPGTGVGKGVHVAEGGGAGAAGVGEGVLVDVPDAGVTLALPATAEGGTAGVAGWAVGEGWGVGAGVWQAAAANVTETIKIT